MMGTWQGLVIACIKEIVVCVFMYVVCTYDGT